MSTFDHAFLSQALAPVAGEVGADVGDAIERVCTDTRKIESGALFVALVGERFDGHQFIESAFEQGAAACLVERARIPADLPREHVGRLVVTTDTLAGLQALASAHLARLSGVVVGLTGSNGKTSTKELCAAALREALDGKRLCATKGNFNNHIGLPLTALEADEDDAVILLEMGMNHLGEIARLAEIARPQVGIVTNIGTAHAGNVGGIEGVAQAKGELFDALAQSGGVAIVNADDDRCRERAAKVARQVSFGWDSDADVRLARAASAAQGGVEAVASVDGEELHFWVPYEGVHNAVNAAAALALAKALDLDLDKAVKGLAQTPISAGRLARAVAPSGAIVLDDTYNANPDSMVAGLVALSAAASGRRRMAALGEMLELDAPIEQHRALGAAAVAEGVTQLFLCGALGKHTADGAKEAGLDETAVVWAKDSAELAPQVAAACGRGDAILVKGSRGSRMEVVIGALLSSNDGAED